MDIFLLFIEALQVGKINLQSIVAISMEQVGYMTATKAIKEGVLMKGLLEKLENWEMKIVIWCDSQNMIQVRKSSISHYI